jgi:protein-tyrosine phosphatase
MGAIPSTPNEIIPGLWIGNVDAADNHKELIARGVRVVIDLSDEPYSRSPNIHYVKIKIEDRADSDIRSLFDQTNAFIHSVISSGFGSVFVHCLAGVSRSGTVIVAYLMWSLGLCVEAALAHARLGRRCINPNSGFMRQLKSYQAELGIP